MTIATALIDTSVLIAPESGRPLDASLLPAELQVCVITIAELEAGIHAARDTDTRATRMATLESISSLEPLPVDAAAAHEWARLRHRLALAGRRINVNDLWIASIAVSRGLPVVTQDNDFEVLADLGGPAVIRV
jgi:predicted nucleic acid-binding protein